MTSTVRGLMTHALLYAITIALAVTAGMQYEARRQTQAHHDELQDMQRRAQRTTAWLRGEHVASQTRMQSQISALQAQLSKDQTQANEAHHTYVAGVRAGTVSVRVPIVPASCPAHHIRSTGSATPESAATYAQLDPAAAADLATIPHEGDAAIRELNLCIAQYNQVKTAHDQWLLTLEKANDAQTP